MSATSDLCNIFFLTIFNSSPCVQEAAFRGLDELDEETLLRMLTFLASNEFVITKRVSVKTQ